MRDRRSDRLNRIDTLDNFIVGSRLIDVRNDNEFEFAAILGEDFPEVLALLGRANGPANFVAFVEESFDYPDGEVAIRAGDEDGCRGGYGWHCEVGCGVGMGGRCTLVEGSYSKMSRGRRPNLCTAESYYKAPLFTGRRNQRVYSSKAHEP